MSSTGNYYDGYYNAEEQRRQQVEAYNKLRSYEALRNIAVTYVDQVLRYKFAAGDSSEGLRNYLEQNYGIPNNQECR